MTTAKGLKIKEIELGLMLEIKRGGVIYAELYRTTDKKEATRLFLALVDKYRTKGDWAVMGGY